MTVPMQWFVIFQGYYLGRLRIFPGEFFHFRAFAVIHPQVVTHPPAGWWAEAAQSTVLELPANGIMRFYGQYDAERELRGEMKRAWVSTRRPWRILRLTGLRGSPHRHLCDLLCTALPGMAGVLPLGRNGHRSIRHDDGDPIGDIEAVINGMFRMLPHIEAVRLSSFSGLTRIEWWVPSYMRPSLDLHIIPERRGWNISGAARPGLLVSTNPRITQAMMLSMFPAWYCVGPQSVMARREMEESSGARTARGQGPPPNSRFNTTYNMELAIDATPMNIPAEWDPPALTEPAGGHPTIDDATEEGDVGTTRQRRPSRHQRP